MQLSEIKKCQTNDAKIIGDIFQRLHPSLVSLCYRYLGKSDDAEDVVMVSWMKVIQKLNSFRYEHPLSFYAWLKRICINECLNLLRSRNNFNLVAIHQLHESEEPHEEDFSHIDTKTLLNIIAQLPNGYRTVFNLFAIEGHSHAEIGLMLNISESTSKSQYRKARINLIQTLKKLQIEPRQNEK